MVMNLGALKSGNASFVLDDIEAVASIANVSGLTRDGNEIVLKVIIEMALLTTREVKLACQIIARSGADFVKTSTGFGKGGATVEDVARESGMSAKTHLLALRACKRRRGLVDSHQRSL